MVEEGKVNPGFVWPKLIQFGGLSLKKKKYQIVNTKLGMKRKKSCNKLLEIGDLGPF